MGNDINLPPYTPVESLGHELGIMFGFMAACILTVGVYFAFWQGKNKSQPDHMDTKERDKMM